MPKSLYTVYQVGQWEGKRSFYQYRYAIEAESAEEATRLVTEDKDDILTDDFIDAPNGIAWVEDGYAEEVANA